MADTDYAPVIDLVPAADGTFIPDLRPAAAAPIEVYRSTPLPVEVSPPPSAAPRYDSGSRGLSDAELADFGTDQYGRPTVTRNPVTGRAEWNPEIDYGGPSFEGRQRSADFIDSVPDTRRGRRSVGAALDAIGPYGEVVSTAIDIQGATTSGLDYLGEVTGVWPAWNQALHDRWPEVFRDLYPAPAGAPTGNVSTEGEPHFQGGQCVGAKYNLVIRYDYPPYGPQERNYSGWYGPIVGVRVVQTSNGGYNLQFGSHTSNLGQPQSTVRWANVTNNADRFQNIRLEDIVRVGGGSDDCGNPAGPATATPTSPTGQPATDTDYPPGVDSPTLPDSPRLPDLPDTGPDRVVFPNLPDLNFPELPSLPDLPEIENPVLRPDTPTPNPDCCPSTERSLDAIKSALEKILQRLEGSGEGTFDLTPCENLDTASGEATGPTEALYEGEGLAGIYSAISAIEKSLNTIHTDTKCPPENTAALPMFWELKHGEIPQLVVAWRKVEAGSDSKWSMTIPHPKTEIDADFAFNFPEYIKGGNMASIRLTDNSQVIVNAFSEGEAQKVIDYVVTLIDPDFLPPLGPKMVYSKGVADFAEVAVKAVHIKKFNGHKTTIPVWASAIALG